MIVDSHTHLGRNKHISASVDQLLKSMDEAGIDKSLVFAGKLNNHPNEQLFEDIEPHNDRLYGVAAWHPNDDEKDFAFLESIINDGRAKAVKFYLGYDHWYPSDSRINYVLDFLEERKVPAIFHCGDCLCTVTKAKLKYA